MRKIQYTFVLLLFWTATMSQSVMAESALEPITPEEFHQMGELMRELRKIKRDDLFVPVARIQLLYLVQTSDAIKPTDPGQAREILRFARGQAYNIASFTWPGWGDTGPIDEARQKLGYSAAQVGLNISKELEDVTPNILWINGAHQLNAGEFDAAIGSFKKARSLARNDFYVDMHNAWIALTRYLERQSEKSKSAYEKALESVQTSDDENAQFFADQLTTAAKIFGETSE